MISIGIAFEQLLILVFQKPEKSIVKTTAQRDREYPQNVWGLWPWPEGSHKTEFVRPSGLSFFLPYVCPKVFLKLNKGGSRSASVDETHHGVRSPCGILPDRIKSLGKNCLWSLKMYLKMTHKRISRTFLYNCLIRFGWKWCSIKVLTVL